MANLWHTLTADEVILQLRTDGKRGLSPQEAERRLQEIGLNAIQDAPPEAPWKLFFRQFQDFMVLVLLGATVLSFLLGETGDGVTIIAIVIMNAILGFLQEYRAEQSVATLKALTAPTATVVRSGRQMDIPAHELVPGDVVMLDAGDRIPADGRILEVNGLEITEAALTGESDAVAKSRDTLSDPRTAVADRTNMVFMGTTVSRGRGQMVVVETGMHTEMGAIAHLIRDAVEEATPLQRRLAQLGRVLVVLSLIIVAVVVLTGLLRGEPLYQMFLTGVSLAVAAIPEGLPAIVTIALALGVQRMIKSRAIVRRLPAVETLGCTTVICSDKTGTLTKNRMTVTEVWVSGRELIRSIEGKGFLDGGEKIPDAVHWDVKHVLTGAAVCNNAELSVEEAEAGGADGIGDPTELALLWAAVEAGLKPSELKQELVRTEEIPFESERQRMTVSVRNPRNEDLIYAKGAPDMVLGFCRFVQWHGQVLPLDSQKRKEIIDANDAMAAKALRVLMVAYRPRKPQERLDHWEQGLIFLGLVGMIDPPRPEALEAVRQATRAGVKTVMITGDHPNTARAIAQELGMLTRSGEVITGRQLDQLSDDELISRIHNIRVYARVSPPHKLRVVRAFKARGEVVAMTGDGVNDAPAVKEADIGVAMGITGTDVTKEASSMILIDDNFATIVRAIEEGRAIYDNIRKFIRYLLSCNVGEVLVMFLAAFLGLPLPLLPIQILFVNLVTDGLPAMALGVDPPAPGVMDRPPRPPKEGIFARGLGTKIAFRGMLIGVSTLLVFGWSMGPLGMGLREARTMALATLIMSQLLHVFDARAEDRSFLEVGLFSNPWALLAVLLSVGMLLGVVYVPTLRELFKTDPLSSVDWIIVMAASGFVQLFAAIREIVLKPVRRVIRASNHS